MRLSIIGAGGFVGQRVAALAARDPRVTDLVLNDQAPVAALPGATLVQGSFADPAIRARVCDGAQAVIHLAAILGGAAEADRALARRINVDATLDLFDHLSGRATPARVVFASTIAVFAKPLPDPVTDLTPTGPSMVYGAHKLMMEVALANASIRGWLDGIALRPAGVMARDGADAALKSAFLSRLFWCVKRGEDITLPVTPEARTWLTSLDVVAQNFLHAALLPDPGAARTLTLPALSLTFAELVAALRRAFPASPSRIDWRPDPELMALFGSYPGLDTAAADRLGFRRDRDADSLVTDSLN